MPCQWWNDPGQWPEEPKRERSMTNKQRLRQELDLATRLLCGLLRRLEESGLSSVIHADAELVEWWKRHQEADRKRQGSSR